MVKRLETSPHDPLGITDSACKNQLVVVSVQYGPFYIYIPIRSTTIGKSRVARDPIAMHTSWRSNSDITSVTRDTASRGPTTIVLRNHNFGLAHRIMVKRLATSPHDPLGITDSACKNQLVMVSVQYGPFYTYIPIRSTTIGKSRVARDPIAMHTSWRSNSDITSVTRVSMTFRVVRTNQYNQDLGLIRSTNGNHLKSPNEGSSIDLPVTIHLHAQNITMLPTNETWYFTSQMLVSRSGGLILILTAQSTRNEFRMHTLVAVVLGQSFVAYVEASIRRLSALVWRALVISVVSMGISRGIVHQLDRSKPQPHLRVDEDRLGVVPLSSCSLGLQRCSLGRFSFLVRRVSDSRLSSISLDPNMLK
ncbi:hypothetical protein F511_32510 [Dorcoceras hygrometricum]|uniref:Triacylglycerol lipase n=1 Tax=Dorcoceras hygrometricum TaxID=472368 RepID=A0A2Z7C6U9_9LAMI|nr:hypothetical protein F511_32510 [Dorcoceras hygrometricum]